VKIGYVRVSTVRQADSGTSLEHQRSILTAAGAEQIFEDAGVSGKNTSRPELTSMQRTLREGDEVLITKLDRLGRNTLDLLSIAKEWKARGITLTVVEQGISTTGAMGELMLTLLGAIAEFERTQILERTAAGREAAKAAGKQVHRPRGWSDREAKKAQTLVKEKHLSVLAASKVLGVSARTVGRMLDRASEIEEATK
jgi:DNA invertase Pin-like site-specific DNA recombinase